MPFGKAAIRRPGKHITIVANLLMWYKAMQAAEELEKEGVGSGVIDPAPWSPSTTTRCWSPWKRPAS